MDSGGNSVDKSLKKVLHLKNLLLLNFSFYQNVSLIRRNEKHIRNAMYKKGLLDA